MQPIPFSDLPFFSDLYCDYVNAVSTLKKYYNGYFRSPEDTAAQIERVRSREYPREQLASILSRQNKEFGAGKKTLGNIEKLREPNTYAIVTGQQVGLLGGPLYTIYKTITALQLCASLREQYHGANFIPVFWLESEDHDFDESNNAHIIDQSGALVKLTYDRELGQDGQPLNAGAVGGMIFEESRINTVLDAVDKAFPQSDFHEAVVKMLRNAYAPGNSFVQAFATFMHELFPDEGLVLLNPLDKEVKELLVPIFRKELETTPRSSEAVIGQSALLEDKYHAQVKARTINIFMLWKNGRYGIDPRREQGDYWLKGTRQYFSREELFKLLEEKPESFSPNVVLRPICQDHLLPTVAYVGGPGEIAYFGQFKPVYEVFGIPMPIIYPRASVTLVEERFHSIMDKLTVTVHQILNDAAEAMKHSVQSHGDMNVDEVLGTAHTLVTEAFESTRPVIETLDQTLIRAMEKAKEKALQSLEVLTQKITDAAIRSNQTTVSQMEKLTTNLLPEEKMQERALNVSYFLNKYGTAFPKMLLNEISLDTTMHQILSVTGKSRVPAKEVQPTLFG